MTDRIAAGSGPEVASAQPAATVVVLIAAALWGFWWLPVDLLAGAGLDGAWIGFAMNAGVLPAAVLWAWLRPGGLSPRAAAGAALVGLAVTLYGMAAYYTDFLRAVLLFYLAPAWSTLIEIAFFGRRWRWQLGLAIALSLGGVALVTRGALGLDDIGAVGDWMAIASGLAWSAGAALIFSARRASLGRVMLAASLGGMAGALAIALLAGALAAGAALPRALAAAPEAFAGTAAYVGVLLAATLWGAFRLPPAVMTYLLSVEIVAGVLSATLILGEPFGAAEAAGTVCILGAALVEVVALRRQRVQVR